MDKRLGKNIAALLILQKANYILPFIIIPYLTRVLGPDNFGKISFVQAVITYFLLLTDYGFNMSSTQQIAVFKDDKGIVSKIFWTTTFSKLLLALIGLLILAIILLTIPQLRKDSVLYLIAYSIVLQSIFSPIWLLQGIEKASYIIPISIIPKVVALGLIFIFVKSTGDYLPALLIQTMVSFLAGAIICCWIFYKNRLVSWYRPRFSEVWEAITDGWHFFLSTAAISLYTTSNIVLLGILTNNNIVGYFVAADKLIKGIQSLIFTIGQAAYPRINIYLSEGKEKAVAFLKTCLKIMGLSSLVASIGIFLFAELIVKIVFGLDQYRPSVDLLRIMAITPFIVSLSYVFGILGLLTFGLKRRYSYIYIVSGLGSLAITIPVTSFFGMYGTAYCIVFTEVVITLAMLRELNKNNIKLFNNASPKTIKF